MACGWDRWMLRGIWESQDGIDGVKRMTNEMNIVFYKYEEENERGVSSASAVIFGAGGGLLG